MIWLLALQLLCPPQVNPAKVEVLNPNIAAGLGYSIRKTGVPRAQADFSVEGDVRISLPVLSVRTITFKKGSRLILDFTLNNSPNSPTQFPSGFSSSAAAQFYLVAEDIEVEDAENPGTITWDPSQIVSAPRAWAEPASPGLTGTFGGGAGGPGASGVAGAQGASGRSAPSIVIIAERIGGLPRIAFCGQQGGRGGLGQPGGAGGRGGQGESASQNAFNCSHGAGNGGPGGNGGEGGAGGLGGQGGDGGSVVFLTQNEKFDLSLAKAYVDGGSGGDGGDGGPGGAPGIGGEGGPPQMPWCRGGGNKGVDGSRGHDGAPGTRGKGGKPGSASVGYLDLKQLRSLMKGEF
jgi:hypothetical protein